ncbi:MAG TPA: hypothetical protein VK365_06555 [Nocardioidaceae bacterium]|nr:hypothetical protein [Nocardioidaceae bacterium]
MPVKHRTSALLNRVKGGPHGAFIHIGPPKTGTTYLQDILWANEKPLRRQGVLLPGKAKREHFRAAKDVRRLNRRKKGIDARGPWGTLAAQMRSWPGQSVVSSEWLAVCGEAAVSHIVTSLGDVPTHVVITARDLGRVVPAVWQERVKNGSGRTLPDFVAGLADPENSDLGRTFWNVHDSRALVRRWCTALPPERVHLVIVPTAGAAPDELWHRFAGIFLDDTAAYDTASVAANPGLGAADAEFLRRVNVEMDGRLDKAVHATNVKNLLAKQTLAGRSDAGGRVQLDAGTRAWLSERADETIDDLRSSGCHVVGDLDELRVSVDGPAELLTPEATDPAAVARAGVLAVRELLLAAQGAPSRKRGRAPAGDDLEDEDLPESDHG